MPQPERSPVLFEQADVRAGDELIDTFGRLAAALLPEAPSDVRTIARVLGLTKATNKLIDAGEAQEGLSVSDMAREAQYASDKHVREGFARPWSRQWASLTTHLLLASTIPVLAEQISTRSARVRREARRLGFANEPNIAKVKPLLQSHLAAFDRHTLSWQMPLATDTRHDRRRADADLQDIEKFELELAEELPASLYDHLKLAADERAELLTLVLRAATAHPELFREAGLDPLSVARRAFPDLVIVDALPHGAPRIQGERYSQQMLPGDHPELLEPFISHGLRGVAASTMPPAPSRLRFPLRLDSALAASWGLDPTPWNVKFFLDEADGHVLRLAGSATGTSFRRWRAFGMEPDDPRAIVLVQRAAETWAFDCAERATRAAEPGMHRAKQPAFRRAQLALATVADAAHVSAERSRRSASDMRR